MESSYWRYLSVYEKEEWTGLKGDGESDEDAIARLTSSGDYNPLEDTRPWYHATYNEVRGTNDVVTNAINPAYVLDGQHDEY
jgi:hypothetical protein